MSCDNAVIGKLGKRKRGDLIRGGGGESSARQKAAHRALELTLLVILITADPPLPETGATVHSPSPQVTDRNNRKLENRWDWGRFVGSHGGSMGVQW